MKKMGRTPEQTLLPRRHKNGKQTYEKMFNFTNYQGNSNQNHNLDITSHLKEWLLLARQVITSVGEVVGKKEHSYTAGGTANSYSHYGKQYGNSSKT